MVSDPRGTLSRILAFVEEPDAALDFLGGSAVEMRVNHTASGNPARFQQGKITLWADTEWRDKLHRRDRALVTALTWPLLLRYGYLNGRG
jgi:hypothetical protein